MNPLNYQNGGAAALNGVGEVRRVHAAPTCCVRASLQTPRSPPPPPARFRVKRPRLDLYAAPRNQASPFPSFRTCR